MSDFTELPIPAAPVEDNAAAVRAAIGAEKLFYGPLIPRTLGRVSATTEANLNISILSLGDSFTVPWIDAAQRIGRIVGRGGGTENATGFWAGTYGTALGSAGTVFPTSGYDWTRSINGKLFRLAAGETLIINSTRADFARRFHLFYNQENGAGTFKVEQDIGAGFVSITAGLDSVNANNSGAITPTVATHDWATSLQRAIRVTCLSGTVDIWGMTYSDAYTNPGGGFKGGIEVFRFGTSSLNISLASTVPQAFFDALIGAIHPDICSWKSDDGQFETYLETYMDKVESAAGTDNGDYPDWIIFGEHAHDQGLGIDGTTWRTGEVEMLAIAVARHHCYVNSRYFFSNKAVINEAGGFVDGLHLTAAASDWLASQLADRIAAMLPATKTRAFPTSRGIRLPLAAISDSTSILDFRNQSGNINGSVVWRLDTSTASANDQWHTRGNYIQDVYSNGRYYFAGNGGFGTTVGSGIPTTNLGTINYYSTRNEPLIRAVFSTAVTTADLITLATGATGSTQNGTVRFAVDNNGNVRCPLKTPSSATDTGVAGTIAWDANYIYICTATNTWKRVAIAGW